MTAPGAIGSLIKCIATEGRADLRTREYLTEAEVASLADAAAATR